MSTQTQYTIVNEVNHRVRSGGFYWKQVKVDKNLCVHSTEGAWYLVSEANLSAPDLHAWLISNTSLALLLNVRPKTLNKHAPYRTENCVYHHDAPISFVRDDAKIKRTRQIMWTLEGVKSILTESKATINPEVKKHILNWITALETKYSVPVIFNKAPAPAVINTPVVNTTLKETVENITDAVTYVINIVEQMWAERNRRRELEDEVAKLKLQIDLLNAKPEAVPVVHKVPGSRFGSLTLKELAARDMPRSKEFNVKFVKEAKDLTNDDEEEIVYESNVFKHYSSSPTVAVSTKETLSDYLSRVSQQHTKVDHLTRMGLLNSDQVYSLFSDFWIDPTTSKLIQKAKFQDILRDVFHLKNSTHRTPILKSEMIRNDLSVVRQVTCKKKPNPVDAKGNKLDLDNPAYTSNSKKCIRFQARYTAKGIDYLKKNWYTLLEESSGQQITA